MAKPGKVTLFNLFCDVDKFRFVISAGEALPGEDKLSGSPHIYIKLGVPLKEFFTKIVKTGITQHWAIVHEDVVAELVNLADILGLNKVVI